MTICHRAKTLSYFEEEVGEHVWIGRQITLEDWENIAKGFGFTQDNYYTPAGKMFAEHLKGREHDGRIAGTIAGITGIITH